MSNPRKYAPVFAPFTVAGVIALGGGAITSLFVTWHYLAAGAIAAVVLVAAGVVLETGRR